MEQVRAHRSRDDCWMVIEGQVFDITQYIPYHPGGRIILTRAGKDGTDKFYEKHPWVNYQSMIKNCWIGTVRASDPSDASDASDASDEDETKEEAPNGDQPPEQPDAESAPAPQVDVNPAAEPAEDTVDEAAQQLGSLALGDDEVY